MGVPEEFCHRWLRTVAKCGECVGCGWDNVDDHMTVNWRSYEIDRPIVDHVSLNDAPRREARAEYDRLMRVIPDRLAMLRQLLADNSLTLGESDEAIQGLNDWVRNNVCADPENPSQVMPEWLSVVTDIALFLGEVMIARNPGLYWTFCDRPKRNISYQYPVVMGFQTPVPGLSMDAFGFWRYLNLIIAWRGAHQRQGKVTVKGVTLDLDKIGASHLERGPSRDQFVRHVSEAANWAPKPPT